MAGVKHVAANQTYTETPIEASLRIPANNLPGREALTVRNDTRMVAQPARHAFQRSCWWWDKVMTERPFEK